MIERVQLTNLGVFEEVSLDLVAGINVFIGGNATGKTHAMKFAYSALRTFDATNQDSKIPRAIALEEKLGRVFRPDNLNVGRLVRRGPGGASGSASVKFRPKGEISWELHRGAGYQNLNLTRSRGVPAPSSVFLPSREVLAMYEGFIAAYGQRELSFDETYFDTAVALSGAATRGRAPGALGNVWEELRKAVGGKVRLAGGHFSVYRDGAWTEAHLVAEGLRKLASIMYLISNRALRDQAVLFWDEPEANLNPALVGTVTRIIEQLAQGGVQVVIATHDYLIAHHLSLMTEFEETSVPIRFFSFVRPAGRGPVSIEEGDSFADLSTNLLQEAMLGHVEYEHSLYRAVAKKMLEE